METAVGEQNMNYNTQNRILKNIVLGSAHRKNPCIPSTCGLKPFGLCTVAYSRSPIRLLASANLLSLNPHFNVQSLATDEPLQ